MHWRRSKHAHITHKSNVNINRQVVCGRIHSTTENHLLFLPTKNSQTDDVSWKKNRKKSNSIIIINAMTLFLFGIKFYIYILHVIIVLEINFAAVDLSVRRYSRKIKMEIFYLFLMTKRTNYVFSFECVWVHIGKRSKREWISWKW